MLLNREGEVKIADFGISMMKAGTYLNVSNMLGTAAYTAPEVLGDSNVDEKCDVYALGVLIWEIMTGLNPWGGLHPFQIMAKVMHNERPRIPDEFPYLIKRLISKCWLKDRRQRPSCSEVRFSHVFGAVLFFLLVFRLRHPEYCFFVVIP